MEPPSISITILAFLRPPFALEIHRRVVVTSLQERALLFSFRSSMCRDSWDIRIFARFRQYVAQHLTITSISLHCISRHIEYKGILVNQGTHRFLSS
ncbi:hypothetical protein ARMGADRAFT_90961 [Armillaria gallica]|uniref:Uncharacterized protein n=1 Tax=Armillaria gallica TaxID=47427 RepID=A0A2H3DGL1_ARMGA|nr:hypothetical protein ARMGADRAFT_90961 [Armillaria gallica]